MEQQQTLLVYRYSFWNEDAKVRFLSDSYATLETIAKGLGIAVHSESRRVPIGDVIGGMWRPPYKVC